LIRVELVETVEESILDYHSTRIWLDNLVCEVFGGLKRGKIARCLKRYSWEEISRDLRPLTTLLHLAVCSIFKLQKPLLIVLLARRLPV
jgi:hypothetical protein